MSSARARTSRAHQLRTRVPPPPRHHCGAPRVHRQSGKAWKAESSAVEHFFCQKATAEEGEPPLLSPTVTQTEWGHQRASSSSSQQIACPLLPLHMCPSSATDVPKGMPDNGSCGCTPPEGDAHRPIEYWEYDEALWQNLVLEGVQERRGVARRDSLTSDEPSEPPFEHNLDVKLKRVNSSIAAWSDYEQDYSARRGSLTLTDCAL